MARRGVVVAVAVADRHAVAVHVRLVGRHGAVAVVVHAVAQFGRARVGRRVRIVAVAATAGVTIAIDVEALVDLAVAVVVDPVADLLGGIRAEFQVVHRARAVQVDHHRVHAAHADRHLLEGVVTEPAGLDVADEGVGVVVQQHVHGGLAGLHIQQVEGGHAGARLEMEVEPGAVGVVVGHVDQAVAVRVDEILGGDQHVVQGGGVLAGLADLTPPADTRAAEGLVGRAQVEVTASGVGRVEGDPQPRGDHRLVVVGDQVDAPVRVGLGEVLASQDRQAGGVQIEVQGQAAVDGRAPLVDLAITVVVLGVAELRGARVDGGVPVVAVALVVVPAVAVVVVAHGVGGCHRGQQRDDGEETEPGVEGPRTEHPQPP